LADVYRCLETVAGLVAAGIVVFDGADGAFVSQFDAFTGFAELDGEFFVVFVEGVSQNGDGYGFFPLVGFEGEFALGFLVVGTLFGGAVAGGIVDLYPLVDFLVEGDGEFCLFFAVVAFGYLGVFDGEFGEVVVADGADAAPVFELGVSGFAEVEVEGFVVFYLVVAKDGDGYGFAGLSWFKGEFASGWFVVLVCFGAFVGGGVVDSDGFIGFGVEGYLEFGVFAASVAFGRANASNFCPVESGKIKKV